jgi:hypothetical protein
MAALSRSSFALIEAQPSFALRGVRAVAVEAGLSQDRLDVTPILNALTLPYLRSEDAHTREQSYREYRT